MVQDGVRGRRVAQGKCRVSVGAVQTLLVPIHHGFPIETAGVLQATAMRSRGKVHGRECIFQTGEVFREGRGEGGDGGEDQPGRGGVVAKGLAVWGGSDLKGGCSGARGAGDRQMHASKFIRGGAAGGEFHNRAQEIPGFEEDGALF